MRMRRPATETSKTDEDEEQVTRLLSADDNVIDEKGAKRRRKRPTPSLTTTTVTTVMVGFLYAIGVIGGYQWLPFYNFLQVLTISPIVACLALGLWPQVSFRQRVFPLTLAVTMLCAQAPLWLGAALASISLVTLALCTLPDTATKQQQSSATLSSSSSSAMPAMLSTFLLVTVMLTENFMIWVVSATFVPGQSPATAPPPLQDNGRRVLRALLATLPKRQVVALRRLWNVQYGLVAGLGVAFAVTDMDINESFYGLATRTLLTLALARATRTVSFLMTVVPSQNTACYRQHFPFPPPSAWKDWIWVGLLPAAHGGCNDLIISGHATVTSTLANVITSVSGDVRFGVLLWIMVGLDYMVEIYEGFHYSVDMWLGALIVSLLYRVLKPVEQRQRPAATAVDTAGRARYCYAKPTATHVASYVAPTLVAYLQVVVLPQWATNFSIIGFVALGFGQFWHARRQVDNRATMHLLQHVLFSMLFMTFAIYL